MSLIPTGVHIRSPPTFVQQWSSQGLRRCSRSVAKWPHPSRFFQEPFSGASLWERLFSFQTEILFVASVFRWFRQNTSLLVVGRQLKSDTLAPSILSTLSLRRPSLAFGPFVSPGKMRLNADICVAARTWGRVFRRLSKVFRLMV